MRLCHREGLEYKGTTCSSMRTFNVILMTVRFKNYKRDKSYLYFRKICLEGSVEDKTREKKDREEATVSKKGLTGGLVVRNEGAGSRVTPGWAESGAIALCRETWNTIRGEGNKVNSGCA